MLGTMGGSTVHRVHRYERELGHPKDQHVECDFVTTVSSVPVRSATIPCCAATVVASAVGVAGSWSRSHPIVIASVCDATRVK